MYIKDFKQISEETINKIAEKLEEYDQDCKLDIDLSGNILSINGDMGTYVINTQTVAEEIWLSSPISGPYHFFYQHGEWISKNNDKLFVILERELNMKLLNEK
ncbi:MAG: iron donor protein CyaY [Rickettsiaceae bacterium]|nr:iron donor protein CyaY [Rickettsiaceae bacterium]